MKKILFGSAAAIFAVAGLSSFKATKFANFYWFKATTNYAKGSHPTNLANTNVAYSSFGAKPVLSPCSAGTISICLVGFTTSQVTALHQTHLVAGGQTPVTLAYTRP